jgi:hypothetical protein
MSVQGESATVAAASGRVDVVLRRMAPALVLLVAVSAIAGACGGGGAGTDAVERAFDRTVAAGTAHFTVNAAASAVGQSVAQSGQGSVDFAGNKVDTTSTPASANDPRSDGTAGVAPDRQIVIGGDVWLSVPASLVRTLPGAKPFAHSTLQAESADVTTVLSRPPNPVQLLAQLRGVDRATIKRLGSAKLRGAATTHFGATVDLTAGAGADPAAAATAAGVAQLTGSSRVPVEVWIDNDGRVRRLQANLHHLRITTPSDGGGASGPSDDPSGSGSGSGSGGGAGSLFGGGGLTLDLTLTTDLFDFGSAVTIAPPPADQVMEASELQGP